LSPIDREFQANPYSPPVSDVNAGAAGVPADVELAERGTRLWAIMVDGLLMSVPLVPAVVVSLYFGVRMQAEVARAGVQGSPQQLSVMDRPETLILMGGSMGLGFLGALAIAIYQWILISRTGQSLGKKWTGIRIERLDGRPMGFGTGVFLRNWIPKLIGSVPYLGAIFWLVDCLFIFRVDRRCVHDHIAGTRVVRHLR
jgi:uncharacterized RDD family membrane protein YckC